MVYVQVKGNEKPKQIDADSVDEGMNPGFGHLTIKKGTTVVGKFNAEQVDGWWIEAD
jgi:hypothetical protein